MALLGGPSFLPRTGKAPGQLVILLHGVGADGRDLIELAPLLSEHLPNAAFFAPDAPLSLRHGALRPPVVQPPGPPS